MVSQQLWSFNSESQGYLQPIDGLEVAVLCPSLLPPFSHGSPGPKPSPHPFLPYTLTLLQSLRSFAICGFLSRLKYLAPPQLPIQVLYRPIYIHFLRNTKLLVQSHIKTEFLAVEASQCLKLCNAPN